MDQFSVFDAKNKLSALLDQVERGREVVITRRGKAVARLVPAIRADHLHAAVEGLRALRRSIAERGANIPWSELKTYRDDGRR